MYRKKLCISHVLECMVWRLHGIICMSCAAIKMIWRVKCDDKYIKKDRSIVLS